MTTPTTPITADELFDEICDGIRAHVPMQMAGNGWWKLNCALCTTHGEPTPDTKKRSGFHFGDDHIQFHCFRCGSRGGKASYFRNGILSNHFKHILVHNNIPKDVIEDWQLQSRLIQDASKGLRSKREPVEAFNPVFQEVKLPDGARIISSNDIAHVNYLINRGFDQPMDFSDIWVTPNHELPHMRHRIFIPYRWTNKIIGYTGRDIRTGPDADKSKYHSNKSENAIYGLDHLSSLDKGFVIVCEGVLDAKLMKGVAVSGNKVNEFQAAVLNNSPRIKIIVPDNDDGSKGLYAAAKKWNWPIANLPSRFKDINDMCIQYGRIHTLHFLISNHMEPVSNENGSDLIYELKGRLNSRWRSLH